VGGATGGTPIVLVSGPPASGKTFVAEALAERLGIPLLAKDEFKETLFDQLGAGDLQWSQRLGRATFALLFQVLELELEARRPVIVEANFRAVEARRTLQALAERYSFDSFEIHCTASREVLLARYAARANSRHPGHVDGQRLPDLVTAIDERRHVPLALGGPCVVLETTDFGSVDLEALLEAVGLHLRR